MNWARGRGILWHHDGIYGHRVLMRIQIVLSRRDADFPLSG
jgi:hypothetical protein